MMNWRRCLCACHAAPDGVWFRTTGVDAKDQIEAVSCCEGCKDTHQVTYAKDPQFRKTKYDPPMPFDPKSQGDGEGPE